MATKFSYGVKASFSNVAPLRCAGEFSEMTDENSEDNFISKTERFLFQSVLKSLKDSIKTLNSYEKLMPMEKTLGIVQRSIDAIATRDSSTTLSLFGWPMNEKAVNGKGTSNEAFETGVAWVAIHGGVSRGFMVEVGIGSVWMRKNEKRLE